ncbi:LOG family protein [Leptolyngbya iicbica]|uniref:LOG family protein n=2 Tax=Cyanophyceae TaxID=3028117 RepID=A0A4Q7EGZ8_9CYAN|nr:LOG family protein [Leptolyngbya sp. LK]RZM82562.1 LOG family protein [Leptolyngbya sp. LK]
MSEADRFRVVIFGSARLKPEDTVYEQVRRLARLLGREGMDVVTGGGPGLMEAANWGHREGREDPNSVDGSSKSYGLNIKLPFEEAANPHVDIKHDYDRFSERLDHFMHLANAVVVAPGGVGTLLELAYTWQLMQVEHICNIPIVLLGDMWEDFLRWVKAWPLEKRLINPEDYEMLYLVRTSDEAFEIVRAAQRKFVESSSEFCLNYQQYKL